MFAHCKTKMRQLDTSSIKYASDVQKMLSEDLNFAPDIPNNLMDVTSDLPDLEGFQKYDSLQQLRHITRVLTQWMVIENCCEYCHDATFWNEGPTYLCCTCDLQMCHVCHKAFSGGRLERCIGHDVRMQVKCNKCGTCCHRFEHWRDRSADIDLCSKCKKSNPLVVEQGTFEHFPTTLTQSEYDRFKRENAALYHEELDQGYFLDWLPIYRNDRCYIYECVNPDNEYFSQLGVGCFDEQHNKGYLAFGLLDGVTTNHLQHDEQSKKSLKLLMEEIQCYCNASDKQTP